jgi:hypothetical protein
MKRPKEKTSRRWWLCVPKVGPAIGFTDRDHAERFLRAPGSELVLVKETPHHK